MKVTAVLCNHAEAANNLLYLAGGGVNRAFVPPGSPPPYQSSLGIGVLVTIPWTQTNQEHLLEIDLVDTDTKAVMLPMGAQGETRPLHAEMKFNVGRPPTLQVGEDQTVALAVNMPALVVSELGHYRFVIKIDGTDMEELSWAVVAAGGMTIPGGPASLPQL